jgi:hypothetical protein
MPVREREDEARYILPIGTGSDPEEIEDAIGIHYSVTSVQSTVAR